MSKESSAVCCTPLPPRIAARRKRVTDAARMLFTAHGFQNSSMAQISDLAGIKVGQIYRDFDGKEAIVAGIVRDDLWTLLDTPALDDAVNRTDATAAQTWIANFCQRNGDAALRFQILAEVTRNAQIAALFQEADRWICMNVRRAVAVIVPDESESRRDGLVELIMILLTGLSHRRFAVTCTDGAAMARNCTALIDREIRRLRAARPVWSAADAPVALPPDGDLVTMRRETAS